MNKRLPKILICDDDETYHLSLRYLLKERFELNSAYNSDEAVAILKNHPIDIILLDVSMRTEDEGLQAIPRLKAIDADCSIVMSSGNKDFQTVREALVLGAEDYLPKDSDPEDLLHNLSRLMERRTLKKRQDQLGSEAKRTDSTRHLIGKSPAIQRLRVLIDKIKTSTANVVITGDTGTGKEVVARMLRGSADKGSVQPFVAIDSSTIQGSMAESILFGHEKGAFTGADQVRKGAFEDADGGVIYFDEIANMPLEIQAKLLRVIQEKEVSRLGSSKIIPLDFRVICATNQNLESLVREGKFKEDLLQRLNVIPIDIPPLKTRREDVALLADYFAEKNATAKRRIQFTEDALQVLENYSWPGNVRELNNLVAYLTAISDKDIIQVQDLPAKLFQDAPAFDSQNQVVVPGDDPTKTVYDRLAAYERQILIEEFKKQNGNISKMALSLGMDRSHLYTKLKTYAIFLKREKRSPETLSQLNAI